MDGPLKHVQYTFILVMALIMHQYKSRLDICVLHILTFYAGLDYSKSQNNVYAKLLIPNPVIVALWGWFSHDVLPVTCCEHGPPSKAIVHFSKFFIPTNILFN